MSRSWFRAQVRSRIDRRLRRTGRDLTLEDLGRSAVVVSPHFDDETLGCGGTILKKVRTGARVSVVFMTDGSTSHRSWIDSDELAGLRAAEGRAAVGSLGVESEDVVLLGFPETQLGSNESEATARLTEILRDRRPEQVFLPARCEPSIWSDDHLTTARAAWAATRAALPGAEVFEYPIWVWLHWPWVAVRRGPLALQILRHTARYGFGCGLAWRFPDRVAIAEVMEEKRAALAAHATQTTRAGRAGDWPILADIAGGEFLECFFRPEERFRRVHVPMGREVQGAPRQRAW